MKLGEACYWVERFLTFGIHIWAMLASLILPEKNVARLCFFSFAALISFSFSYGKCLTVQHLSGQKITKKKIQRKERKKRKWEIWKEILACHTTCSFWEDFSMTLAWKSSDPVKIIIGFLSCSLVLSHPQSAS